MLDLDGSVADQYSAVASEYFLALDSQCRIAAYWPEDLSEKFPFIEPGTRMPICEAIASAAEIADLARLENLLRDRETFRGCLVEISLRDGSPLLVRLNGAPQFAGDGTFTGYKCAIVDVTAYLQPMRDARRELAESLSSLDVWIENCPAIIFMKDLQGRYRIVNQRYLDWRQATRAEMIGDTAFDHFPREIAERVVAQDREVAATRKAITVDQEVLSSAGEPRTMRVTKFPILDADGEVSAIGAFNIDVTDQIATERALRDSEARFQIWLDNFPGLSYLKGLDGRYQFVSRHFAEWSWKDNHHAIGFTAAELFPPDAAAAIEAQDAKVVETGEVSRETAIYRFGELSPRVIASTKFPVYDTENRLVGLGGVNIDVTEQRAIEKRLQQTQKMEALGQLAGGIAHDFNNMLTALVGNLELLSQRLVDPDDRKSLERALDITRRGAALTDRILNYSRRRVGETVVTDINAQIDHAMQMIDAALGSDFTAILELPSGLWHCKIEPLELENSLLNLCINARDAMPEGGAIEISTRNVTNAAAFEIGRYHVPAGDFVAIAVTDHGQGMTPEIEERVLEPFFTTKQGQRGTGLGLSTVFAFVQRSGGELTIESESGAGTTVTLYLPRTREPLATPAAPPGRIDGRAALRRILVVEDDPDVRMLVSDMLTDLGYSVEAVATGRGAVNAIEQSAEFDVVLTDIVLAQELDGIEVAAKIAECRPDLRVIFMSGHALEILDLHGKAERDIPLIRKPFLKAELADFVAAALES